DYRGREHRKEDSRSAHRLVPDYRPCREQAPVLGGQNRGRVRPERGVVGLTGRAVPRTARGVLRAGPGLAPPAVLFGGLHRAPTPAESAVCRRRRDSLLPRPGRAPEVIVVLEMHGGGGEPPT